MLNKDKLNPHLKTDLFVSVLLCGVMFAFINLTGSSVGIDSGSVPVTALLFSLTYLGGLCYFSVHRDFAAPETFLFSAAALAALVYMRVSLMPTVSPDYDEFLVNWLAEMKGLSLRGAVAANIGDYNTPYLYFLAIVSRFDFSNVILIKWLSCCFDVVLAAFCMRTVALFCRSTTVRVLTFVAVMATPTVFLNSAHWGQCDSVFAAFCVASMYYCLRNKSRAAVIMFSVAFTIKLQAIFILPALIVCLLIGRIRLRDLAWFPAVFVASIIPAILCGRPVYDTVSIYLKQADSYYNRLVLNAPTFYQLFGNVKFDCYNSLAIMLAGTAVITFIFVLWHYRESIGQNEIVMAFLLSALIVPYFLPRMHDRYFFIADVISVVYFLACNRRMWYVPLTVVFSSFVSYSAYILGGELLDQKYTSFALLTVIILLARELVTRLAARSAYAQQGDIQKGDNTNEPA